MRAAKRRAAAMRAKSGRNGVCLPLRAFPGGGARGGSFLLDFDAFAAVFVVALGDAAALAAAIGRGLLLFFCIFVVGRGRGSIDQFFFQMPSKKCNNQ